ncbi:MAG: Zn-ribbon domain-containing OB-fold protein [Deltaproteobacteria bacterium]|nr:Zn-ribbon domain-containing OB-fold protein [Deltaproteobacteria bacterium]
MTQQSGGKDTKDQYIVVEQTWSVPFRHYAGEITSRYLREFRDNKKIMGRRCPKCKQVLVPARKNCERCFTETDEWVEVKDEGRLVTFSINCIKYVGMPDPPYIMGLIKLDGADTAILHFIRGIDLSDIDKAGKELKIGTRMKAVWKKKRVGNVTDIDYFQPA